MAKIVIKFAYERIVYFVYLIFKKYHIKYMHDVSEYRSIWFYNVITVWSKIIIHEYTV